MDQLKAAGQSYWQILPLTPTSYGDSPYQSFSSFAGNPYFIDLEALIEEGVLTKEECDACDFGADSTKIDYGRLYEERFPLLRLAYERSDISKNPDFLKFAEENAYWLDDYALFMSVKKRFQGDAWINWAEDIKARWGNALDYYRRECYFDIEFYKYLQFKFNEQWMKLKKYANANGIEIIGDIPIYVALDSADAWSQPQMFQFDDMCLPTAVAGCPPDAFSADGQLWGNPLYDWEYHKNTGYDWWCRRVQHCFRLYDVVRIDHFRGFDAYYSIPYGDKNALGGHWVPGPGMDLFRTLKDRLCDLQIVAEDLGLITPSVGKLLKDSGFPGMKVLEFAFESGVKNAYLPHNYDRNCVVYTGTHDNETLLQWFKGLDKKTRDFTKEYIDYSQTASTDKKCFSFIRLAMMSCANTCIIPFQDYAGLDKEARINFPSTTGSNWMWRMTPEMFTEEQIDKIYAMTKLSARLDGQMRKEDLEAEKKAAEEEARKKAAEEEARKKAAEEEAQKKLVEEEAQKKAAEAEAAKKAAEEQALKEETKAAEKACKEAFGQPEEEKDGESV